MNVHRLYAAASSGTKARIDGVVLALPHVPGAADRSALEMTASELT